MLFEEIKSITFFKSNSYHPFDSQAELAERFVWRRVSHLWINVEWGDSPPAHAALGTKIMGKMPGTRYVNPHSFWVVLGTLRDVMN